MLYSSPRVVLGSETAWWRPTRGVQLRLWMDRSAQLRAVDCGYLLHFVLDGSKRGATGASKARTHVWGPRRFDAEKTSRSLARVHSNVIRQFAPRHIVQPFSNPVYVQSFIRRNHHSIGQSNASRTLKYGEIFHHADLK